MIASAEAALRELERAAGATEFKVFNVRLAFAFGLYLAGGAPRPTASTAAALEHLEPTLGADHPATRSVSARTTG